MANCAKRKLLPLLLLVSFSTPSVALPPNNCSTKQFDTVSLVTYVFDGDTVKLANKQHVRLIGVNAPEMHYGKNKPEPLADEARQLLAKTVLNKKVGLKFGKEKKDSHRRTLAHLFLLDGSNVQSAILTSGLATNIAVPPNLAFQDCYQFAELAAKTTRSGIWDNSYYNPIPSENLNKSSTGYKRISGQIKNIIQQKSRTVLTLGDSLTLVIYNNHQKYFQKFDLSSLLNSQVIVNGWIRLKNKQLLMTLKHPSAIEITSK